MISNKESKTKRLMLCGLFSALITVGAFIQIPVPHLDYFTLQFLFVLLAGILLGSKLGSVAVAVYVLTGLMGIPIFAAGGGISYILRPSFGYLLGFIAAAFVTGWVCERLNATKWPQFFGATLCGFVVTYGIGLIYKYLMLNTYVGTPTPFFIVLLSCFPLDIPGDLVLCIVASRVSVHLSKALKGGNL